MKMAEMAPAPRVKLWKALGIMPRSVDREVVETMHRTHIGVDADYKNVIKQGLRTALADGWGGSMIGTELSDVIFSLPNPLTTPPTRPARSPIWFARRRVRAPSTPRSSRVRAR